LMQALGKAPVVELLGVVDASGVAGAQAPPEPRWMLVFSLAAWRVVGQPVQRRELAVRKLVAKESITEAMKRVQPLAVVRLRARVAEENVEGKPHAMLERFVDTAASDAELEQVAEELGAQVTFEDPHFGTFTLDRRVRWFETKTTWKSRPITLALREDEAGLVRQAALHAKRLWDAEASWDRRIIDYATSELLALCNESWRENPEAPPISGAEFARRIAMESIDLDATGDFAFWLKDGDLFAGHMIEVRGTLNDGPTSAGISG
jgi:hypothetical protein